MGDQGSARLTAWWLALWVAGPALAAVRLPPDFGDAGVRYAVEQLEAVSPVDVGVTLIGGHGAEGFALTPTPAGFDLHATRTAGVIYGLLELRDRLRRGDPPRVPEEQSPDLRLRGDVLDFPFYLGCDLYEGRWRIAAGIEHSPEHWWLDRGHWSWRLKRCAEMRQNALLIGHPHPFPGLVDLPDFPEAAYFPPEHLARLREHFAWILEEAEQYGVRVYLLTWNIWVSPGFAAAHGVAQEGADTDLTRRYTRACYRRLCETYPKLAGVMTMAGEAPAGCVEFVHEAIVPALGDAAKPPELLFWTWCSYPEDARAILEAYRGPKSVVHYLQYEQLFRPQADPRIARTSEALGGLPVVTMGGLGTATGWMYWSDPYYLRDILADVPRQHGDGCFFGGLDSFVGIAPKWLGWEALARYGWSADRPREDAYWHERIAAHYGTDAVAADYLTAAIAASSVTTRQLALLHRQTDHHHPQFGLPLVAYLGLPTLSSYVFENHTGIDAEGRLTPRGGLTWPNPDWGERVLSIPEFTAGAGEGTSPLAIADELQAAGDTTLDCVARLRPAAVTIDAAAWTRELDMMSLNGWLGRHVAAKIRAAVAWQRWCAGAARPDDVLAPLTASVEAFEQLVPCFAQTGIRLEGPAEGLGACIPALKPAA